MNLNYRYDKASLKALALTADKKSVVHTLVVDFDGEVVLDPEIHFPGVAIISFKFFTQVPDEHLRDEVQLASMYDALDEIFNSRSSTVQSYMGGKADGKIAA
jgi:hypothetical protein